MAKRARGAAKRNKAGSHSATNMGSGSIAAGDHSASAGKGGVVNQDNRVTNNISINSGAAKGGEKSGAFLEAYLKSIITRCCTLPVKDIAPGTANPNAEPLELASIYVDLNTELRIRAKETLAEHLTNPARGVREAEAHLMKRDETRRVPVLEALACHRKVVLLGPPGSGKSTLLHYASLALAEARLGKKKALGKLGTTWTHGLLLPVTVTLRHFAAEGKGGRGPGRAQHLWDFIGRELAAGGLGKKAGEQLQAAVARHGALFLLDGLDETKEPATRARVAEAVAELMRTAGPTCRFVLTSRPYAWEEINESQAGEKCPAALAAECVAFAALLSEVAGIYRVAEFEPDQTALFIERWYRALTMRGWITVPKQAEEKDSELKRAVQRDDLRPLARNPLLLTLMAALNSGGARLPDDRAELYDEVVKLMLGKWNENIGREHGLLGTLDVPGLRLDDVRDVLQEIAFEVHGRQAGKEGTADIAEGDLVAALKPLLQESGDKAGRAVEFIEHRAGLLLGQGSRGRQRQFTFPHRTFQEFLAGCHLAGRGDFEEQVVQLAEANPRHWQEVLKLAARRAGRSRGVAVCDVLANRQDAAAWLATNEAGEKDWRKVVLAAGQLCEIGLTAVAAKAEHRIVRDRIAGWLVALLERSGLPAKERAAAGDLLAHLGDPRPGVVPCDLAALAQMEFCHVPRGVFLRGDELTPTPLDYDFWIGRHLVTVRQFQLFDEAGGYAREEFWREAKAAKCWRAGKFRTELEEEWRAGPGETGGGFGLANRPVVNVSWYEATAFCHWLTEAWKDLLPAGWRIALPGEVEWEKAARGGMHVHAVPQFASVGKGLDGDVVGGQRENVESGRKFPWRGEFDANCVNCAETGIGETSVAGCFAVGASPCGAEDMAGNAWEWSRSHYEADDRTREGARVLRGGAFDLDTALVRCAFRFRYPPDLRYYGFGFRVVASPFSEL